MTTSKPTATSKSGGAKQVSVQSKEAVPRRRMNIQMVQNVPLIWLDNNIDAKSADCRNTIVQLRRAVNTINTYTDAEQCIQFLETMDNEKACMIISGSLGQQLVPRVHNMPQVDSIFVFCGNKKYHEEWAKKWSKVKGVYTEIGPICEALKKAPQQCEQDSMGISFVSTRGDTFNANLNQLPPSFMYTQILKEILLSIKFEQQHIDEFVQYCREALAENRDELKNVQKFEEQYRDKTSIWWYACECFLYPMPNRTLRLLDANMIVTMRFFIPDLHRHIEQLHQEQFPSYHSGKSFIVYRGQGLSNADFEQMSQTKGGLMSFNNFFSMHTVFRIGEITPMDGNSRLFQVKLILTSDNDKDLRALTDRIREETSPNSTGWYRLGSVLRKMGQSDKAQQVYEILLEQTTMSWRKQIFTHVLGILMMTRETIKKHLDTMKSYLRLTQKHFLPLTLIWLVIRTTSVLYVTTWMTTRKYFRLTKKHLQLDNNHFLRTIIIWLCPTTTSARSMKT